MKHNSLDWMREIEEFSTRVKDYLENVSTVPAPSAGTSATATVAKRVISSSPIMMDMIDRAEGLHIEAELPGVVKSDIRVSVQGNMLEISATRHKRNSSEADRPLMGERSFGTITRQIELDPSLDLDIERITATYLDGLLTIMIAKRATAPAHSIPIQ